MQDWVGKELNSCSMADKRLVTRLGKVLDKLSADPERSIPAANDSWAETQGTYRFLSNAKVNLKDILSGHKNASIQRIQNEKVVLIPQDTTFFNFARQKDDNNDLGGLTKYESDKQLLHVSAAFTPDRINLGVVDANLWKRPEKAEGYNNRKVPIEEKESIRWLNHYKTACDIQEASPDTLVVSVADREGDIHEWFTLADGMEMDCQAGYIVRAKCNRRIETTDDEYSTVWDHLNESKKLGEYKLNIPQRGKQKARTARIAVRAAPVNLTGRVCDKKIPVEIYVVFAKEIKPPAGIRGVEWMLLTNIVIEAFDEARTIIEWYRARWEIEVFFRVLKGGCQAKFLRLETPERLENCLAVYLIVSWHIHNITMLSRSCGDIPCNKVFSDKEWKTIVIMKDKKKPPKTPPSLYEVTRKLALLGGFIGRKGDGEPGVKAIWIGYQRLMGYIEAMDVAKLL